MKPFVNVLIVFVALATCGQPHSVQKRSLGALLGDEGREIANVAGGLGTLIRAKLKFLEGLFGGHDGDVTDGGDVGSTDNVGVGHAYASGYGGASHISAKHASGHSSVTKEKVYLVKVAEVKSHGSSQGNAVSSKGYNVPHSANYGGSHAVSYGVPHSAKYGAPQTVSYVGSHTTNYGGHHAAPKVATPVANYHVSRGPTHGHTVKSYVGSASPVKIVKVVQKSAAVPVASHSSHGYAYGAVRANANPSGWAKSG